MRYNKDRFARLVGAGVRLASPAAAVSTSADSGYVTLLNGQVFRFTVEETTPEAATAAMAAAAADEGAT